MESTNWEIGYPYGKAAMAEGAINALMRLIVKGLPQDSSSQ
jgi:hypothetical protein